MRFKLVGMLLSVLALPVVTVQAQPPAAPIVAVMGGDVVTWTPGDSSLTQWTQDANIQAATLSPDGSQLAVSFWSPISVEAVARAGGIGGGPLPADIGLIDLASGQLTVIATQPPDASFQIANVPENALTRSTPVWSPDGSRIAWTELHYPESDPALSRLLIYTLRTGDTQILATDLPEGMGVPMPLDLLWGGGGIALYLPTYDPASATQPTDFLFYDPSGTFITLNRIPDDGEHIVMNYMWVSDGEQDWLAVGYASGAWDVINPVTGVRQVLRGEPTLISRMVPESSIRLGMGTIPDAPWGQSTFWMVTYPDREVLTVLDYRGPTALIAPDGQTIATLDQDGTLTLLNHGAPQVAPVVLDGWVTAISWGPTTWQVEPLWISLSPEPVICDGALPSRLVSGQQARVIPNTSPNNLREAIDGAVIGQIAPGETFTVMAGPRCVQAMAWWQVSVNGAVGWTAEGDASAYWLEPLP